MNKRQRKKHRRSEFQELGFPLRFCTTAAWTDQEQDTFWFATIVQIEALGLAVGGGTDRCWDVYVTGLGKRASVTAAQRQALIDWLAAHPDVSDIQAGELEDAWHDGG